MDSAVYQAKKDAFQIQIGILRDAGYGIERIFADAGDGYGASLTAINGPKCVPYPSGRHVGIVEAKIRRTKETARCLLHSLPFKFDASLIKWAIRASTYYQNLFPTRNGYKGISPRELLKGIKVDAGSCSVIGFGEFAWVAEKLKPEEKNTIANRVFPGIALMPTGYKGGFHFHGSGDI